MSPLGRCSGRLFPRRGFGRALGRPVAANEDGLADHRQRDFFRGARAYIDAGWGSDTIKSRLVKSGA